MREHHDARYPFLFVQTTEEERIIRENRARFDEDVQFFSWDIAAGYQAMVRNGGGAWTWRPIEVPGFVPKGGNGRITDPGMALEAAGALPENSLVFLKDYPYGWIPQRSSLQVMTIKNGNLNANIRIGKTILWPTGIIRKEEIYWKQ